MKLNEKISFNRKQAGLSQEGLAEQVGVSRQAVSKWELGEATPEVEKLLALARAFGVTTDELLSESEPAEKEPEPAPAERPQQAACTLERQIWRYRVACTAAVGLISMVVGGFLLVCNRQLQQKLPPSYMSDQFTFDYILSIILIVIGAVGIIRAIRLYQKDRKNS